MSILRERTLKQTKKYDNISKSYNTFKKAFFVGITMATSNIAMIAGILSLLIGVFMLVVCFMFIARYSKRKAKSIMFLTLSTFSWLGGTWSATVIYLVTGMNLNVAIAAQKLVYAFVFAGTIFTLYFAYEIFYEKAKKTFLQLYTIVGVAIIAIMLATDSVDQQGFFPDEPTYPLMTIGFEYSIILIIFIIPVVLGIFAIALKMRARTTDKVAKAGLGFIAGGQICILFTFVADTLGTVFVTDVALYPVFLYATWMFPLIAIILYYLGWIMPDWLKKAVARAPTKEKTEETKPYS